MTYAIVDLQGQLLVREQEPTPEAIARDCGGPTDQVRLHPLMDARGFVNDTGHVQGMERNVVGSLLLIAMGAVEQPYAGQVVITGWDPEPGDDSEVRALDVSAVALLRTLHSDIRRVIGMDDGEPTSGAAQQWCTGVLAAADVVRHAATPTLQIVTPDGGWPL